MSLAINSSSKTKSPRANAFQATTMKSALATQAITLPAKSGLLNLVTEPPPNRCGSAAISSNAIHFLYAFAFPWILIFLV